MNKQRRWKILLKCAIAFSLGVIWMTPAVAALPEASLAAVRNGIPGIAERYVGMPYAFGADPEHHGAADNSHLICAIYGEAARNAGFAFPGYMPMKMLLARTIRIHPDMVEPGDLMVLKDGHAAMIYHVEDAENFDLIYASLKRGKVVAFNSRNLVYEVYWRVHLDGFYRFDPTLSAPVD
ncbi:MULTISPECIES: hypothetical protein [Desulfococcus]|jgi:hypothetical protein|nr:hypothetical protein [Desulfococcus multivorans]AQV00226.1 hypothetical protein B2D07_05200 [Desulfococcus multivorans]